jgi:2-polyprenyl-3-methyl-5-hydroxy-6-metoxy-1,4-benzoquinol methylase
MKEFLKKYCVCPGCKKKKLYNNNKKLISCKFCQQKYPIIYGIPILITKAKIKKLNLNYNKKNFEKNMDSINFNLNEFKILIHLKKLMPGTSGFLYKNLRKLKDYPIGNIPFEKLNKKKNINLLDLGCGWGRWTLNAAQKGYNAVGIDISLISLIVAKKISEQLNLKNCKFICCDVLDMPLTEKTFDKVFSYSFLQHFSENNLKIILKLTANKMNNHSIFKTQMVNKYGLRSIYNFLRIKYYKKELIKKKVISSDKSENNFNVRYFSISKINQLLEKNFFVNRIESNLFFTQALLTDFKILTIRSRFILIIGLFFNFFAKYFTLLNYVSDNLTYTLNKKN